MQEGDKDFDNNTSQTSKGKEKLGDSLDSLDAKFSLNLHKDNPKENSDDALSLKRKEKQSSLEELKKEIKKRDDSRLERYMDGIMGEKKTYGLRTDRHSPEILTKMLQNSGDMELAQMAQAVMSKPHEKITLDNYEESLKLLKEIRKGKKTWAYFKRGFFGIDAFFIAFSLIGVIGIPVYFIIKQRKKKERIRREGLSVLSVHDIDEFDDVDIDDISPHTTYYDREGANKRRKYKQSIQRQKQELYEQLDEKDRRRKDRIIDMMDKQYKEGDSVR